MERAKRVEKVDRRRVREETTWGEENVECKTRKIERERGRMNMRKRGAESKRK